MSDDELPNPVRSLDAYADDDSDATYASNGEQYPSPDHQQDCDADNVLPSAIPSHHMLGLSTQRDDDDDEALPPSIIVPFDEYTRVGKRPRAPVGRLSGGSRLSMSVHVAIGRKSWDVR